MPADALPFDARDGFSMAQDVEARTIIRQRPRAPFDVIGITVTVTVTFTVTVTAPA